MLATITDTHQQTSSACLSKVFRQLKQLHKCHTHKKSHFRLLYLPVLACVRYIFCLLQSLIHLLSPRHLCQPQKHPLNQQQCTRWAIIIYQRHLRHWMTIVSWTVRVNLFTPMWQVCPTLWIALSTLPFSSPRSLRSPFLKLQLLFRPLRHTLLPHPKPMVLLDHF